MMKKSSIIILVAVMLIFFSFLLYRNKEEKNNNTDLYTTIQQLYSKDSIRNIELRTIRNQRTIDSARIAAIIIELDNIPVRLEQIKKEYNGKRSHINNLPVDSQISYMSTWLSEKDSDQ